MNWDRRSVSEQAFRRTQARKRLLQDRLSFSLSLIFIVVFLLPAAFHHGLWDRALASAGCFIAAASLILAFCFVDVWFQYRDTLTCVQRLWRAMAVALPSTTDIVVARLEQRNHYLVLLQYLVVRTDACVGLGLATIRLHFAADACVRLLNNLAVLWVLAFESCTVLAHWHSWQETVFLCKTLNSIVEGVFGCFSHALGLQHDPTLSHAAEMCQDYPLLVVAVFTHFLFAWCLYFYRVGCSERAQRRAFFTGNPEGLAWQTRMFLHVFYLALAGIECWLLTEQYGKWVVAGSVHGFCPGRLAVRAKQPLQHGSSG